MNKAASLRRLLLAAERRRSLNPLLLRFFSRSRSPNSPSIASPQSSLVTRSFSAFNAKRPLLPSKTLPFPRRSALSSASTSPARHRLGGREEPDEDEVEQWSAEWEEEEDDSEPVIGDGGDGGGVVLGDVKWGERALSLAREVLDLHFGEDLVMYAFKVSPRGYVYVRLDKLTNNFGCPSIEEIENFNSLYKKRLDESVDAGEIPLDLALEVSSAGAERLLRVPGDLDRFKEMPMRVQYVEEKLESNRPQQKDGVFLLESVDTEAQQCVWKLADVKENRDDSRKGRPLNRRQRDWRLQLQFEAVKRVALYLD